MSKSLHEGLFLNIIGKYLSWTGQNGFFTVMNGLLGVRAHCLDLRSVTRPSGNVTSFWGSKQVRNYIRIRRENKVLEKKKSVYSISQKSPEKFLLIRMGKTCL